MNLFVNQFRSSRGFAMQQCKLSHLSFKPGFQGWRIVYCRLLLLQ